MYSNMANQNPLVNQFNGYMSQNPNSIPFQGNQLINQNVHVMNNLNTLLQQQRNVSLPTPQQKKNTSTKSNNNIIEDMLKPQKISKVNKDISPNYKTRQEDYKLDKSGKLVNSFKVTNSPYKNIIKDKTITKDVSSITVDDLIVHKTNKAIDANPQRFNTELGLKTLEKDQINTELKIEYHIDNYNRHKKNFEYNETFIRSVPYNQNTFDESKKDYIDFYCQKQKEAEEGKDLCDKILHLIKDDGIVNNDEVPQ